MTTLQESVSQAEALGWEAENPFADPARREAQEPVPARAVADLTVVSPFGEETAPPGEDEFTTALSQTLHELREESFDEAVAELLSETEAVLDERFHGETAGAGHEMRRLAEAHLAPVGEAAEAYLDRLQAGVGELDLESLDDEALEGLLDSFDPELGEHTPAAEQFLGGLVKKAKSAVKQVARKAKKVARKAAGALAARALARLKALARPLLKRVLDMAIDKLPAPLRAPARTLAKRITLEAEAAELEEEQGYARAVPVDPEELARSFDVALAEGITAELFGTGQPTGFAGADGEDAEGTGELEQLALARRELLTRIRQAGDEDDLAPAIEQFLPALLTALRLGIKVAGRKRVVGFLAGYVSRLIRRWVGPRLSGPLSSAIVDTGLRLMTLEQPDLGEELDEAGATALAGTIEDTIRGLAEQEDFVLEDDNLMQLAVAEAFERAVATNFPPALLRSGVPATPRLGGFFVTRRPATTHPYRRYSMTPEVELTVPVAEALPTFGGVPVAAVLRARGVVLPQRYRVRVYEAVAGTSLRHLARAERVLSGSRGPAAALRGGLHPLTPHAAGVLLQEPALGSAVPPAYLRSPSRVAAGQRFYHLEPVEPSARLQADDTGQEPPSRRRVTVDTARSVVTARFYVSEEDAQEVAAAVRQGRGVPALLRTLLGSLRPAAQPELELEAEGLTAPALPLAPTLLAPLRRRVTGWVARALSDWSSQRAQEFARAAAEPAAGVTVTVTLAGVPGLTVLHEARRGRLTPESVRAMLSGQAYRGQPTATVVVRAGRAG